MTRITAVQIVAERKRRSASELARITRRGEEIAEPADGLDDVDAELLADATDEHLDGVRVAVEILVVEMLHQLGARNHPAGVMHQVREQAIFMRRELDRVAVHRHPAGAGIEAYGPAIELALGMTGRPAQQRPHARQHFFEMKRL